MAINDTMCADCECHSTQLVHPKLSGILVHKSEILPFFLDVTVQIHSDIAKLIIDICRNIV